MTSLACKCRRFTDYRYTTSFQFCVMIPETVLFFLVQPHKSSAVCMASPMLSTNNMQVCAPGICTESIQCDQLTETVTIHYVRGTV